ncbi:hypothetical protein D3C87_1381490 [compost metagenome]
MTDRVAGAFVLTQQLHTLLVIGMPGGRGNNRAIAGEQPHAQLIFQLPNMRRHAGLSQPFAAGSDSEGAFLVHGNKHADVHQLGEHHARNRLLLLLAEHRQQFIGGSYSIHIGNGLPALIQPR